MQRVGELLKAEREKKGLSLHEIGMSLKINPKILKAIEDNDSTQLPAKTFLRGFVRSYAQFLRMDVKEILQLLHAEIGSTRPEEPQKVAEGSADSTADAPSTATTETTTPPRIKASTDSKASEKAKNLPNDGSGISSSKIITVVGSIVLILLIIFVAKMVDKYQKESKRPAVEVQESQKIPATDEIPNTQIPATVEAEAATNGANPGAAEPLVTPLTTGGAAKEQSHSLPAIVTEPNHPTTTGLQTPAVSTPVPASQTPAPKPTATPIAQNTPTPTPAITPTPSPTPAVSPTPSATPAPKPVEVIVEALSKVDIKYSFDNEKWNTITLQADQLHTFKSKLELKLEVSDGGAVSLIVNGRERGVPGTIGKPIKLSYPK